MHCIKSFFEFFFQVISSQRLMPPYNYPQMYSEAVIDRYANPTQIPPISPADNDALCKNLATAIQSAIFDRFSQSCYRTPVFGPIAAPLVNEIKNSLCTCPMCSSVNLSPNSYSKSFVSPNAVSNVIKSSVPSVVSNTYPRGTHSVGMNRNFDIMALLKGFGCECGCRPVVWVLESHLFIIYWNKLF